MKRKGICKIFIALFCMGWLLGCGQEKATEGDIILHAGIGAWEMDYIWEGTTGISEGQNYREKEIQSVRYIYDSLPVEVYLGMEKNAAPMVLIANKGLGYKIRLGTGQSYQMQRGDRLFLKRSSDVEIYTSGAGVERKSCDRIGDICEVCREQENLVFRTPEHGRGFLFYQCTRQKGKLYITYF